MKRYVAIAGLLLLACQIALGGAGSLFLCLCESEAEHSRPCESASDCGDSQANLEGMGRDQRADSLACHGCADILIEASPVENANRGDTTASSKAAAATPQFTAQLPQHPPRLIATASQPKGQRERLLHESASSFTRNTRLLI